MAREWLDKRELAEYFGLSVRTIERWIAQDAPCRKIVGRVRFHADEVEVWLEETGKMTHG